MNCFYLGITLLLVLLVGYWVWPFFGLRSLAADIQARDPVALSGDVDFVRLRRSLTEQIIAAYLQVTGRAKDTIMLRDRFRAPPDGHTPSRAPEHREVFWQTR